MRSMRESLILAYHSLDGSGSVISTTPLKFQEQMQSLATSGARVVGLDQVALTPGSVAITFDDGYMNFFDHALPVLTRFSFPATVFVVTAKGGGRNDWDQRGRPNPVLPLMDWPRIREAAAAGVTIGSHSHTHAPLTAQNAHAEIQQSCREIEDRLGVRPQALAYPYGEADASVRKIAAEHFEWACSIELDFVRAGVDRWWLPRVDSFYAPSNLPTLLTPAGRLYLGARRILRNTRRNARRNTRAWLSR